MQRRIHAGDGVWATVVTGLLLIDKVLIDKGHESLSSRARAYPVVSYTVLGVFGLHLLNRLGRFDPFHALGRIAGVKRVVVVELEPVYVPVEGSF